MSMKTRVGKSPQKTMTTKKFNGETFKSVGNFFSTKREASAIANDYRKNGYMARIVERSEGWYVYVKQKLYRTAKNGSRTRITR